MDIESVFLDISKDFNLSNEDDSKSCYLLCQKYAKENIENVLVRNEFISFCSNKLKQVFIHEMFFTAVSKTENILVRNEDNKTTIYANKSGLQYLINSMTMLKNSNLSGEHIHLDKDDDVNLISNNEFEIAYMNDEWFLTHQNEKTFERNINIRNIDITDISIVVFLSPIPPFLIDEISQNKPYKVNSTSQFDKNTIAKSIRDSTERMIRINITGNNNNPFSICIDMDDIEVCLITGKQLSTIFP